MTGKATGSENRSLSVESVAFLKALKANNTREWFADNKPRYEQVIKRPAAHFCAAMAEDLEELTGVEHASKLYRIHRDLRFAKDKTPYNTHVHISFIPQSGMPSPPCWFFGLDADVLKLGAGVFAFDKPALEAFRARVSGSEGPGLAKLLNMIEGEGVTVSEPELKRVPAGYPADHACAELLRRKGLSTWIDLGDAKSVVSADLVEKCRAGFSRLKPAYDWLMAMKT